MPSRFIKPVRHLPLGRFVLTVIRLLTNRVNRIGRRNVMEIMDHSFFENVDWSLVGKGNTVDIVYRAAGPDIVSR